MTTPGPCRIYLSTGEMSGDVHAARLARALQAARPGTVIEATGGPALAGAGVTLRHSSSSCAVMGLIETMRSAPAHVRLYRDLRRRFEANDYDLLIVVDYPGFHLRLAEAATRAGTPVLFYIPPQLWAWGAGRSARLAAAAKRVAVILPFEEPFFRKRGIPATFVGHPLLDSAAGPSRSEARRSLGIPDTAPTLAVFPGSRPQEVRRLWPPMRGAARLLRKSIPDIRVIVAAVPGCQYPASDDGIVWRGSSAVAMAAADAGLCKSGTTTLEAALSGLPMVVTYRMHPFTYAVARRAVRLPWISLVNLVAEQEVVPERLQGQASEVDLASAVLPLLDTDGPAARSQREGFQLVRARLGRPGASQRVADLAWDLVA